MTHVFYNVPSINPNILTYYQAVYHLLPLMNRHNFTKPAIGASNYS
jgi:hypothetical protein